MPGRTKKKTKKNVGKRKMTTSAYRRRSAIPKISYGGTLSGISPTRRVKLLYCETVSFNSTAGSLDYDNFRANGIYDPNNTGTGHQPMGFDTWATLYNHYVVHGSKINVIVNNDSTAAQGPRVCGVNLTDTTAAAYTNHTGYIEARKGMYKLFDGLQTPSAMVSSTYDARTFFNLTDVKDNVSRIGAAVSADPTEASIYQIWYQTLDGSTKNIYATVLIEYDVEFSEPKDLAQS